MTVEALRQACSECPWRRSNHGRRHAHGFYTAANRDRLWNGLRTSGAPGMSCHPTDGRMAEFEGYEKTEGRSMRECAGALALVQRELLVFQSVCQALDEAGLTRPGLALRVYRKLRPRGLTHEGLAHWAFRTLTPMNPLTGATIGQPTVEQLDQDVGHRLPWDGAAVTLPQAREFAVRSCS